ncbi:hypothetical protein [Flagellimonas flava]|uniref:Uncharacterized protein n=1 Tax=Flagellimonas flava TaxID=570519 RepID=A0A1M5K730_9FLAO|nr:hypothetical protein [Allomuricauda flava]SHG48554.1 hypothetical protein SAMN04488116_1416 [Allomuricauda flava]
MTKSESYIVEEDMNAVYDLVSSAIKKRRYNLAGEISENGGLDITPNLVFWNMDPNAGHMTKVNLSAVNISTDQQLCKLELKRVNGLTYKIHTGGAIGFILLTFVIIGIYTFGNSDKFQWEILLMPLFGLFYLLVFQGITTKNISNTKTRILKILKDNKINYKNSS